MNFPRNPDYKDIEFGCAVPLSQPKNALKIIHQILMLDAQKAIGNNKIIEIRLDKKRKTICWYHLSDITLMLQEPLFNVGVMPEEEFLEYILIARIKT